MEEDPLAELFNNPRLSDVCLVLATGADREKPGTSAPSGRTSRQGASRPAKARKVTEAPAATDGAEPHDAVPCGRQLSAHQIVLLKASPVWKAELMSWSEHKPKDSQGRKVLVLPVEEEELCAAEAFVKFGYTGRLEAGVAGAVQELLRVYRLADRMQAAACTKACLEALRAVRPSTLTTPDISAVMGMPEVHLESQALQPLVKACTERLVQRFGDVPAVLRSQELLEELRALPLPAVLTLVQANELKVTTEDDVLALVEAYCVPGCDAPVPALGIPHASAIGIPPPLHGTALSSLWREVGGTFPLGNGADAMGNGTSMGRWTSMGSAAPWPTCFVLESYAHASQLLTSVRLHHLSFYVLMEVVPLTQPFRSARFFNELEDSHQNVVWQRSRPGRALPPGLPETWRPTAPKRSGGLPAPPLPGTTFTEEGLTAEWKLPMAELKSDVRQALLGKNAVKRFSPVLALYQGLEWHLQLIVKCAISSVDIGLYLAPKFTFLPSPRPKRHMELHGALAIKAPPGPSGGWTERVLGGAALCKPGSGLGWHAMLSLPEEGWEAELGRAVARDSQGMVTVRVRGARTEF